MQGRHLAITLAAAVGVLGLGGYVIEMAKQGSARLETRRVQVMAGQAPTSVTVPDDQGRKAPATPEAQVSETSVRLNATLTRPSDKARVAEMATRANGAIVDGNQSRFDGLMLDLANMERAALAECTVEADLDEAGLPRVGQDLSTGKMTLKGTCWAEGAGDIQKTGKGGIEHATDFPCDVVVGSRTEAERLAATTAKDGYVYGEKHRGEVSVRWATSDLAEVASN